MNAFPCRVVTLGLLLALPCLLHAQLPSEEKDTWANGPFFLGEFDGVRTILDKYGLEPFVDWTGIASGNPVGGARQGHVTAVDDFYMGLKVDLSKFSGWRGATVFISGVDRDGTGLTNSYVKSQYNSQQTVGGQSLFFYQLFLRQQLADGKVTLKLGRFAASDDLNESPIYGRYLNNGFNGDIRNVLFDTQFSAYPFATYAALVQLHPNTRFNFQMGAYQTWNDIFHSSTNGVDWRIRSSDGVIFMEQAEWTPKDGHYWVGSTYSPWKGFAQFGSTQKAANSYGFYAHGDHLIYRGLTLWAAAGYYPQQRISIVPFQVSTGVLYQGLFPNRPKDRAILGFIHGEFSRDYARTQIAEGKGDPSHEMVLEIGYRFRIHKFFFFQPDVQGSLRPAGTGRIPNALVAGAEAGVVF